MFGTVDTSSHQRFDGVANMSRTLHNTRVDVMTSGTQRKSREFVPGLPERTSAIEDGVGI